MSSYARGTWFVVFALSAVIADLASPQQPLEKQPVVKKAEVRAPAEERPPLPDEENRPRRGQPADISSEGFGERQPHGAPGNRRPGGRGPEGVPGPFGQPPRDGRPPRDGGLFGPTVPSGGFFPGETRQLQIERMKAQDPEMYELESKDHELERQTEELSQQLRRAPRDQREALKKQLNDLVQKHFDARQARRELQFKRLEADLEKMRESMKKRVEMREQIIGRRIAELSGEQNEFDF